MTGRRMVARGMNCQIGTLILLEYTLFCLSSVRMAAKGKARTLIVRLISTAQTGYFYTTQRVRTGPRLSAVKYDPIAKARVLFVESKKTRK